MVIRLLDSLLIHSMFISLFLSGSQVTLSLSSFFWSGEAHLILPKSLIKFPLAPRFIYCSTFIARLNAFVIEWCLALHLNALLSHSSFHWSHQNSSASVTFKPPELYQSYEVLEVPFQMLSFPFLFITLALLHTPHWAPVSWLLFYYPNRGMHKWVWGYFVTKLIFIDFLY